MANRRVDRERYWRGIFEDWSKSELSQRRFCAATKISYSTFCYWRRQLAELNGSRGASMKAEEAPTIPFIPVEVKPSVPTLPPLSYEVTLGSGHRIGVPFHFEPDSLDRLIALLEDRGC